MRITPKRGQGDLLHRIRRLVGSIGSFPSRILSLSTGEKSQLLKSARFSPCFLLLKALINPFLWKELLDVNGERDRFIRFCLIAGWIIPKYDRCIPCVDRAKRPHIHAAGTDKNRLLRDIVLPNKLDYIC